MRKSTVRQLYTPGAGRHLLRGLPGSQNGGHGTSRRRGFCSGNRSRNNTGLRSRAQYLHRGLGPNPALAGILAGFFPFGVGAVYTGQYAKGLAHLVIFGLLVAGASASDSSGSEMLGVICGLGIAFFYVYQIIDSVRSARALQMGQPAPDPFGLAQTFSTGRAADKIDTTKIPTGAVVLILLGVFFLLRTAGLFEVSFHRFWPLLLIFLGGWIFANRWGVIGGSCVLRLRALSSRRVDGAGNSDHRGRGCPD